LYFEEKKIFEQTRLVLHIKDMEWEDCVQLFINDFVSHNGC